MTFSSLYLFPWLLGHHSSISEILLYLLPVHGCCSIFAEGKTKKKRKKKEMTVGGLANINIDCDKKEVSIFCKHGLPQTGSKIIGVVSVLFVQQPVTTTLIDSQGKICSLYIVLII